MEKIRKLIAYIFSGQFGKIIRAVRRRIPGYILHSGRAFIFELDKRTHDSRQDSVTFPEGYHGRFATEEDLAACAVAAEINPDEYADRLRAGQMCFATFVSDRVANLNWIHRGPYYVRGMGYWQPSESPDRYIYGVLTVPSERGKGIYRTCLLALARHLFAMDSAPLIQMVEADNAAVLHTLPKIGYVKTHAIRHITVMGIKYTVTVDLRDKRALRRLFLKAPDSVQVI